MTIAPDWQPTPANIEMLPIPIRDHIARLEAQLDEAKITIDNLEADLRLVYGRPESEGEGHRDA